MNCGKIFFSFLMDCLSKFRNKKNRNWIKRKGISFGNNCICKILEVEITQLCITSVFVVSGDFVFRTAGFLLFKWSYILKFLTDYSQLDFFFSLSKERIDLIKGNITLQFFS